MTMQSQERTDERAGTNSPTERIGDGGTIDSTLLDASELTRRHPDPQTNVGAAVLAAGEGSRYEGPFKLLETVDGEPLIKRAVAPFVDSCLEDTVVVVGYQEAKIRAALADLDVSIVRNDSYEEGQSSSLRLGVEVARESGWEATVFGLGDMPFVTADTVDLVVQAYLEDRGEIVAPAYEGKRGNPTIFGSETYAALAEVTGDTGGRPVLRSRSDVIVLETGDPGVLRDVDEKSDL